VVVSFRPTTYTLVFGRKDTTTANGRDKKKIKNPIPIAIGMGFLF